MTPNILLIMTDQQRGDALSIDGHPVLQTPYVDHVAAAGHRFAHAYSTCPICIPARRTLMTGKKAANHGVTMNYNTWLHDRTLPQLLSDAGFQTHLCGKLHLWPHRKSYGFESADWADNPHGRHESDDDYQRFLRRQGINMPMPGVAHGANSNGWAARPWHLEERYHFTNWVTDSALEFLDRRDPTRPFFLNVSYHQPHQPCTPPQVYWDRYADADLPNPPVGDWARVFPGPQVGQPVASWRTALTRAQQRQFQAGYFGCINHIDDQIGRLLTRMPSNTIIAFVSDHGEMLGDHQWIRKRTPYQGAARIPFILHFPRGVRGATSDLGTRPESDSVHNEPVELMDLMPTLLDAVGIPVPADIDGVSLMPLVSGENAKLRDYLHGECAIVPSMNSGMQYLTDGRRKFIRYPGTGHEEYFDLEADPMELENLIDDETRVGEIQSWRDRLIAELDGRPEGFVRDGALAVTGGPAPPCLPGYDREPYLQWIRPER